MGFIIVLSMIIIAFFANSILNKNKKNIGIMRALGMRNLDIIRIFALQIFYMSLIIIGLTFASYFLFVSIGNEILIKTFIDIYRNPIIGQFTLISANLTSIITDLIITIFISALTILVQMNLLKRIDVINIIKPKE
jgi:ABC-type antimicrobial peptide transport system permease subunit